MTERITQDVSAKTRVWKIDMISLAPAREIVHIDFRSDDGRTVTKNIRGADAVAALQAINTRDNSTKSLHTWLLEQAQSLWPEDFSGTLLTD